MFLKIFLKTTLSHFKKCKTYHLLYKNCIIFHKRVHFSMKKLQAGIFYLKKDGKKKYLISIVLKKIPADKHIFPWKACHIKSKKNHWKNYRLVDFSLGKIAEFREYQYSSRKNICMAELSLENLLWNLMNSSVFHRKFDE